MAASLPFDLPGFEITQVHTTDQHIDIYAASIDIAIYCPSCTMASSTVHSLYTRRPLDLPCQDRTIRLHLQVRRFFCHNSECQRRTFTESIDKIAPRHGRRTNRFTKRLVEIGLALGGEHGGRLAQKTGLPTSGDTILRVLHKLEMPKHPEPQIIGIDDWAWLKGMRYGTILCDLERRHVIDLLPDAEAKTVIEWLKGHSGITVVSRDRSASYGDAITRGAPQAQQVADRWHLLKNLREALEQVLTSYRKCLTLKVREPSPELPLSAGATSTTQAQATNRQRRLTRYQQMIDLHQRGVKQSEIAERLGLSPRTVTNWLAAGEFPERKARSVGSKSLRPYLEFIQRRWDEGCHNASQIWREMCEMGYDRSRNAVLDYVARLRQGLVLETPERAAAKPPVRRYSPPEAARLLMRNPERLTAVQAKDTQELCEVHPAIKEAYSLVQSFLTMVGQRLPEQFGIWMRSALSSSLTPFRTFATGLHRDRKAVVAALSSPWSNGQVEGQINRLKLIKRQMYGRASFTLLRVRVMYPS